MSPLRRGQANKPSVEKLERDLHALQREHRVAPSPQLSEAIVRSARRLGPARLCPECHVVWSPLPSVTRVRHRRVLNQRGRWVSEPTCPRAICPDCLLK